MRIATGATPYSLVYGMEAVLPVEVQMQSMRVLAEAELPESEWAAQRFDQLALLDEKKDEVLTPHAGISEKVGSSVQQKGAPYEDQKG